ncbi:MAG: filamentous hemagglutinin N-terminal domain-containing protein [Aphanizomenon gracile PMC627.10]|nr:filamentous hemagglutinin N-terminal domain-containing protein [Aphanizomenon gracile PMC627.10]
MKTYWQQQVWKLWIATFFLTGMASSEKTLAQIIPDTTLGKEGSVVKPINSLVDRIDGGAIRGVNLFHSFQDFNISEGRGAYFTNPTEINNILSRVTGHNPSHLFGTLGVLGNANLFFINPNGIVFGPNAKLDIAGSFVSSTANSVVFPDGNKFSSTNPETPPLLTINVSAPVGLEFATEQPKALVNSGDLSVGTGENLTLAAGAIISTGKLSAPGGVLGVATVTGKRLDNSTPIVIIGNKGEFIKGEMRSPSDLQSTTVSTIPINNSPKDSVKTGDILVKNINSHRATLSAAENLTLVESNLQTSGDLQLLAQNTINIKDSLTQPFIAKTQGNLLIQGNQEIDILALNHPDSGLFSTKNIFLRSNNTVLGDARYFSGGDFRIEKPTGNLGNLSSPHDPVIRSQGDISFDSYTGASLHIFAGGSVNIPGNITITGLDTVNSIVEDITLSDGKTIISINGGTQPTLDIRAGTTAVGIPGIKGSINNLSDVTDSDTPDSGANISIGNVINNSGTVLLTNQYFPKTSSQGGDIKVGNVDTSSGSNGGSITIDARGNISTEFFRSGFESNTSVGNGGDITLKAEGDISTGDINSYSASSFDSKNAGNISLNAVGNISVGNINSYSFSDSNAGIGGDINLNAVGNMGNISTGDINSYSSSYFDSKNAGNINLNAVGNISVGNINSYSFSDSNAGIGGDINLNAVGNMGNISTGDINSYSSSYFDSKNAGNIGLNAVGNVGNISAGNISSYSASYFDSKNAGNIDLKATGSISTGHLDSSPDTVLGNAGNAGNITLNAGDNISTGNIKSYSLSSINLSDTNKKDAGNGGNISLVTQGNIYTGNLVSHSLSLSGNSKYGGTITLNANADIVVQGYINSATFSYLGSQDGGNITLNTTGNISTGNINSSSDAELADSGNGGSIILSTQGNIYTRNLNSYSSSSSGNAKHGGSITVNTQAKISAGEIYSFSYSYPKNAGDGGDVNITATNSSIEAISPSIIASFSLSEEGNSGNGGKVNLQAKDNISNLEILTLSSSSKSGALELTSNSNLSVTNTKILTSKRLKVVVEGLRPIRTLNLNVNGVGKSGDVRIINSGNITFNNSRIESDTKGSDPAGNVNIISPGLITFNNSQIISNTSESGQAGNINIEAKQGLRLDSSQISAITNSVGKAGTIDIKTPELTLSKSTIAVSTENIGNAGNINLQPHTDGKSLSLNLQNESLISSSTSNQGTGGNLIITAADSLKIAGQGKLLTGTKGTGVSGKIDIASNNFHLQGVEISASTENTGKAGTITLNTPTLTVANGGKIVASTSGTGQGGTIVVNAPQKADIGIGVQDFTPIISVETSGAGKAGDIILNTPNLNVSDTARITATATKTATNQDGGGSITLNSSKMNLAGTVGVFADTQGQASAGTLKLTPDNNQSTLDLILAKGATISASTFANGKGGDLILTAPQGITISGAGKLAVETKGTGNAGNIEITTPQLTLKDGVEISASSFSSGKGGSIIIKAPEFISVSNSNLLTQSHGTGAAGSITIETSYLNLAAGNLSASNKDGQGGIIAITANGFSANNGGQLRTTTTGNAKAGNIILQVSDQINLEGINTGFFANTEEGSTGNSGIIFIDPNTVNILEGAQIAVNSQGEGIGGDVQLIANTLNLNNGKISAQTRSNTGGNITLKIRDILQMRNGSEISTTAGDKQFGGNGGNIKMDAPFIVAFPRENADITANAFQGQGGNVQISTQAILGLEYRLYLTNFSDITASSDFGVDGQVIINTPGIDPSRGLTPLPDIPINTQIVVGCQNGGVKSSISFIDVGRTGLPSKPDDLLNEESIITDWVDSHFDIRTYHPGDQHNSHENIFNTQASTVNSSCYAN